jgi:hypothetical protein
MTVWAWMSDPNVVGTVSLIAIGLTVLSLMLRREF